ncbi:MAG: hypothetical protein FRX49_10696 [Trebouxia sp. A1-2]|nr:MAG: hypothetical protein FRX49_10696 [Trebouxia sp. A1-2]
MARFASEAELETFLGRLEPDYSPSASTLWQQGVKTAFQLANARESILLACGLSELYIDDIKARADRTGGMSLQADEARAKIINCEAVDDKQKAKMLLLINTEPDTTLLVFTGVPDFLLGHTLSMHLEGLRAGSVAALGGIASDRQVAQRLLMFPLQQAPANAIAFEHFLYNAQFQLPNIALDCLVTGIAGSTERDTTRWVTTCLKVLEEVDAANPDGIAVLLRFNSSEKDGASGKGPARVDTVANAFRLSLLFGEDKVLKQQGLEHSWKDLEIKLASGYPALFYGQIPYLPIYAAAGVHIQFGLLMPHGQVDRVGRILNVSKPSDRIWLCQALVNILKYLTWAVTQAPRLTERVELYQPIERPNATRITLNGNAAVKEISNSDAFYAQFGNSFEAISCVEEVGVRKRGYDQPSTNKLRVPQDLSLQDWDEGTLDDKRQYTSESDVYQIGVMLLKFLEVSAASRAFADKLKSMSVSAADAAEDTYFL